jgi:hypothetical protein
MQWGIFYYFDSDCIIPSNYLVEVDHMHEKRAQIPTTFLSRYAWSAKHPN